MRDMFFHLPADGDGWTTREALQLTFKMINAETQLLYSSDYPHWDMDLPSTIHDLPFLSEQAKRKHPGRQRPPAVQPRTGAVGGKAAAQGGAPRSNSRKSNKVFGVASAAE